MPGASLNKHDGKWLVIRALLEQSGRLADNYSYENKDVKIGEVKAQ